MKPQLAGHAAWFVDANLTASGLEALLAYKPAGTLVAADAVSVAKAPRLGDVLPRIDLLFCNVAEAAALADPGPDVEAIAGHLLARGAGAVVLTQGARGALCADANGMRQLPAVPASLRDVTGAGDSLVAATLLARLGGAPLPAALASGLAAAALTLASEHAVRPDLSPGLVAAVPGPVAA